MAIGSFKRTRHRNRPKIDWNNPSRTGQNDQKLDLTFRSEDLFVLIFWSIVFFILWFIQPRFFGGWYLIDFIGPWIVYLSLKKNYAKGMLCAFLLGLLLEGTGTLPVWSAVFWNSILLSSLFFVRPFFSWTKPQTWLYANMVAVFGSDLFYSFAAAVRGHNFDPSGDFLITIASLTRSAFTLSLLWLILKKKLTGIVATNRKYIAEAFEK